MAVSARSFGTLCSGLCDCDTLAVVASHHSMVLAAIHAAATEKPEFHQIVKVRCVVVWNFGVFV